MPFRLKKFSLLGFSILLAAISQIVPKSAVAEVSPYGCRIVGSLFTDEWGFAEVMPAYVAFYSAANPPVAPLRVLADADSDQRRPPRAPGRNSKTLFIEFDRVLSHSINSNSDKFAYPIVMLINTVVFPMEGCRELLRLGANEGLMSYKAVSQKYATGYPQLYEPSFRQKLVSATNNLRQNRVVDPIVNQIDNEVAQIIIRSLGMSENLRDYNTARHEYLIWRRQADAAAAIPH